MAGSSSSSFLNKQTNKPSSLRPANYFDIYCRKSRRVASTFSWHEKAGQFGKRARTQSLLRGGLKQKRHHRCKKKRGDGDWMKEAIEYETAVAAMCLEVMRRDHCDTEEDV